MHDFFQALVGLGVVLCAGTGLICAVRSGTEEGPNLVDAFNLRGHWRGVLQVGAGTMRIGIVGLIAVAISN
jgi:hypothetical protein